jgi:outer membrane protein OmpA-like peptidoglycan-associated protein
MRKLLCSCAAAAAMLAPQIVQARTSPVAKKKAHHTATDGKNMKAASPQAPNSTASSSTSTTSESSSTASTTPPKDAQKQKFTPNPDNPLESYPQWLPMAAFTGGLGLFTINTGDTLPQHGLAFEAGVNKFSRDPGSITVLQTGWSFGYGITDRLTAFVQFDVHNHVHVDNPAELSLDAGTGPQYGNTIYNTIVPGGAPAYVEDYPFAYTNNGGIGNIDVGAEYGLLSERRGDKASLAVRGDVYIPTVTSIGNLLINQSQSGATDFQLGANLSKTILDDNLVLTSDFGYRIDRNPPAEFNNSPALTRADQINVGAGFLAFPQHRIQIMSEYTGVIFVGSHTPDTSFGARDPVDTVWGIRAYLAQYIALDVGYRYMLNLHDVLDRNGFVIKVGTGYWPEKVAPLPVVSVQLTVDPTSVVQDAGQMVTASAHATDSQNLPLNYTWTATGGNVVGTGPNVRWDPSGLAPGSYSVSATADDSRGGTDSASAQITVEPKPAPPPTMACSVDRATVQAGEKVNVTAAVNDQTGTPLTYQWQANAGQISGSGASVQLDTTGLAAGNYTITGRVQNGRGGAADCTATVAVQVPPPPPQASKINQCYFTLHSARIDNVCKRILDDVAVRLQTDPKAKIVVIGYATPRHGRAQRLADKLAKDRAENAKKYLSEKKGVDTSRIDTRTGTGAVKAGKENRRMDIILVPDGASY